MQVDAMNDVVGKLGGYDCPDCKNKGFVYFVRDGNTICRMCKCADIRDSINRVSKSGLSDMLSQYTFSRYDVQEPWQLTVKKLAMSFVNDNEGKWLFVGGQVGSGKTHICTAVVGELINQHKSARYMLWRDDAVKLKACVNDDVGYAKIMNPLKTADVLYIDDMFKTKQNAQPTPADVNIAFELLNYRYCNPRLVTIISCELSVMDMIDIDEAVGSRIYQRTKDYCIEITKDKLKNYRLNGGNK